MDEIMKEKGKGKQRKKEIQKERKKERKNERKKEKEKNGKGYKHTRKNTQTVIRMFALRLLLGQTAIL